MFKPKINQIILSSNHVLKSNNVTTDLLEETKNNFNTQIKSEITEIKDYIDNRFETEVYNLKKEIESLRKELMIEKFKNMNKEN